MFRSIELGWIGRRGGGVGYLIECSVASISSRISYKYLKVVFHNNWREDPQKSRLLLAAAAMILLVQCQHVKFHFALQLEKTKRKRDTLTAHKYISRLILA